MTTMSLSPAEFTVEGMGGRWFPGFTKHQSWNGFACPYFTLEQAKAVAEALSDDNMNISFSEESKSFAVCFDSCDVDIYEPVENPDGGEPLYCIGAFGWCWFEKGEGLAPAP